VVGRALKTSSDQLEELNSDLNSFITIHKIEPSTPGPLSNLTFGIKDVFYTKGIKTTAGSKVLRDFIPDDNAWVVQKILDSGGKILGKTNTHEFAFGATNTSSIAGPARNPADRNRITGGSSGGSVAAVASRMVDVGIGSDTGGSIRIPASLCGVLGFKPTRGRVPLDGVIPLSWTLDTIGISALRIDIIRKVFSVLSQTKQRQMASANLREKPRLGKFLFDHSGYSSKLEPAMNDLEKHFEITDAEMPLLYEKGAEARRNITLGEAATYHKQYFETRSNDYFPDVRQLIEFGREKKAMDYVESISLRDRMIHEYSNSFSKFDLFVSPTTRISAPRIDSVLGKEMDYRDDLISNTEVFNVVDAPSISIPVAESDGLPLGLMISGAPFQDDSLLDAAERILEIIPKPIPV
jgi:aspartyl-tRNA(Asn)/glutamyl-tRNA(Gln) amidotransferase subunit A